MKLWSVSSLLSFSLVFSLASSLFAIQEDSVPAEREGLPLLVADDFEEGLSRWEFTDRKAWRWEKEDGNGVMTLLGGSEYEPPYRSPYNMAILSDIWVTDFVLQVDVQSTGRVYGHRDMCFFYGMQSPSEFYYTHLATQADAHANSIFLVDQAPRVSIAEQRTDGTEWLDDHYHTVLIKRDTGSGRIEVYFDDFDTPVMTTRDETFSYGRVGLGSFDDSGKFDRFRLWGKRTEPRPMKAD